MSQPKVLSIFSGAGGLDIGFHRAGFNVVACIDIDSDSCSSLELNRGTFLTPDTLVFNSDITQIDFEQLYNRVGAVDFVIGGPPCQSFSAAGRRAGGVTGVNDTRGSLFWYYCKLLEQFQPSGFLFENVRGILQANKSKDWNIIQNSFAELGYILSYRVLDAADYGVPQHRERVIMVGHKRESFLFPRPTHGPDSVDKTPYVTSGDVISDLDDPNEVVPPYGGKYGDLLPEIPPGLNYSHFTERMGHPKPRFAWRSRFSGFLYKLDPDKPSKTIVTQQGRYDGPFHWKNRKLTINELKRIQSFPDSYELYGSNISQIRQIGNSVAPLFGYELAKAVMNQYFEERFAKQTYISESEKLHFDKRKSKKAQRTRQKTQKNRKANGNNHQLSLFQDAQPDWPSKHYPIKEIADMYSGSALLEDGTWNISIVPVGSVKTSFQVSADLHFNFPVNESFKRIKAQFSTSTLWDIQILWESIHNAVNLSSSYDSLHPLYGHFTEPYPKFALTLNIDNSDSGIARLIQQMAQFQYLGRLYPLETLEQFVEPNMSTAEFVKKLRKHGFDVRVHETNRTIPSGFWKPCYPYTLPKSTKTFVPWTDIGKHKTGDLRLIASENGYIPHELNYQEQN